MALNDVILVNEGNIRGQYLYQNPNKTGRGYYHALEDLGLLPLTVETLTREPGTSLLNLATWTYFSGSLSNRDRFAPGISGSSREILEQRIRNDLQGLKDYLTIRPDGREINIRYNRGAFGRLMHAMGLQMPVRELPLESGKRRTKPHFSNGYLPKYIGKIIDSEKDCETELEYAKRKDLLKFIGRVFVLDRFKSYHVPRGQRNATYFLLGNWASTSLAIRYARQAEDLLGVLFGDDYGFKDEQISITTTPNGLHLCKLYVDDDQIELLSELVPKVEHAKRPNVISLQNLTA